jgi:hypothetical protein
MLAVPAGHVERPHAELAHVAERRRLDRLIEAYLGRRTLDTTPWPPSLAWHWARSAARLFALMRLLVPQFAVLQEHVPITSARLAEGIATKTANANRDARTQPRLRAMSTLSIFEADNLRDR